MKRIVFTKRIARWVASACFAVWATSAATAQPPTISDPNGWLPVGTETPGTFPQTVTSTNMNVHPIPGSEPDGPGSNDLKVTFPAGGPIPWTEVRHNEGDIAMAIGPFDPNDPSYYPPDVYQEWKPGVDGQPFSNASLSWRVNVNTGGALASVRHNGVNNQDTFGGTPVGVTHGVANFVLGFSQGVAFRMSDGALENGGDGSSDLIMGIAGTDAGLTEASFNVGAAYFPYEQGWLGAWVEADNPGFQATYAAKAAGVPDDAVNWNLDSTAFVTLPGIDSATDGMLFVSPSNSSSSTNIAAGAPRAGGWDVAVREDNDTDLSGNTLAFFESEFQLLYVPYDAHNLIGGHVEGSDGSLINAAGSDLFDLSRTADGAYAVSVYTDDSQTTKRTEDDGMFILSVAGHIDGDADLADRTFLSYEYDAESGDFVIQSRELFETFSANTENVYGDWLKLRDSDFYLAWVDFDNPFSLTAFLEGDFDTDGDVDGDDFLAWQGGFGTTSGATKADGDYDNDGDVDGDDFLGWQSEFGSGDGSGAVPEPSTFAIGLLLAGAGLFARRRR